MNWDWLLGFIEGEGSFTISLRKDRSGMKYQILPYFQMNQIHTESNRLLFIEIQKFLRQEGINSTINKYKDGKFFFLWKISIYKLSECLKFASHLKDLEWHTSKKLVFLNWIEALKVMESGENRTLQGLKYVLNLRENVKNIRGFETHTIKFMLANNTKWREWISERESNVV